MDAERSTRRWAARIAGPLVVLVGLVSTAVLVVALLDGARADLAVHVAAETELVATRIHNHVTAALGATTGVRALLAAGGDVSQEQYVMAVAATDLGRRYPAMFALNAGPVVPPELRDDFAAWAADQGIEEVAPPASADHVAAIFAYGFPAPMAQLRGMDITTLEDLEPTVRATVASRTPQLSPPTQLQTGAPGFVLYDITRATLGGQQYDVLIAPVFEAHAFLDGLAVIPGLEATIVDVGTATVLGTLGALEGAEIGTARHPIEVLGRTWEVRVRMDVAAARAPRISWLVLWLGVGLSFALGAVVWLEGRGRRRAESVVDQRTAELRHANRALVRAAAIKDDFLAMVSHELRTPLAMILGFAETARERQDDAELTALSLERIERHGRRLEGLLDKLLRARALDAGVGAAPVPVALAPVVRAAVTNLGATDVDVDVAPDLTVLVDPEHALIVVENLLGNARSYGRPPIAVRARVEGEHAVLTVRDHGDGVPEEVQDEIWQRFRQGEHGDRRTVRGIGLGLALVRELVAANGGDVGYRLAPGGGAAFEVTLRIADGAAAPLSALGDPAAQDSSSD